MNIESHAYPYKNKSKTNDSFDEIKELFKYIFSNSEDAVLNDESDEEKATEVTEEESNYIIVIP